MPRLHPSRVYSSYSPDSYLLKIRRLIKFLVLVLCIGLLSLTITLGWSMPTVAQIFPDLNSSENERNKT